MRAIALLFGMAALGASGCSGKSPWAKDPEVVAAQADLSKAQAENLRAPSNRYQVAGKREYGNGTEIYVLDGKTGQVCYYFVASGRGGEDAQKSDLQSCAGSPLNPAAI